MIFLLPPYSLQGLQGMRVEPHELDFPLGCTHLTSDLEHRRLFFSAVVV